MNFYIVSILTYLKPLKQSKDKGMPIYCKAAEEQLQKWKGRQHCQLDYNDNVKEKFALLLSEQENEQDKNKDQSAD